MKGRWKMLAVISSLFAQAPARTLFGLGLLELLTLIVVVAGAVAIVAVVLRKMEITVPAWFLHILLIIVLVFVGVVALRFIFSI